MALLRFITCGSVDDGKSSLIGRLLWETRQIPDDQLAALEADSRRVGTRGGEIDTALLLDGLSAEREQGITIDVAYRHFATARRSFIVADTPGHEQYTRNMVTGASTADLAIVLVDARKGVLQQTRRHSYLLALIGVRQVILAVNKMDLVGWSQATFEAIETEYRAFAARLGITEVSALPLCATLGDNVVAPGAHMPWSSTPPLLDLLEAAPVDEERRANEPLRLPVQLVSRPDADFRGYAGLLAAGTLRPGQRVRVLPSGRESEVTRIVTADGDLPQAQSGQSVTVTLADEIDIARGDLLCAADSPAEIGRQFQATIVWMHEQPLLRGRNYLMKIGTRTVGATVAPIRHKVNVHTLEHVATETLALNEIGVVELELDRVIAFDPYERCRETGGFILIDRQAHHTVGAGLLSFALRRSANVHWQALAVDKLARQRQAGHRSGVVWLTGLSGAGKSTLASALELRLHAAGRRTYVLDGDNVRHGLNKDLGFNAEDRVENIRRVAEVARLMVDAGVIVIASFISPFRSERAMARELFEPSEFLEVFVDVPLAVAEQRDAKGLYAKARRGELRNFTGIDSPYEAPEAPDLHLDMAALSVADAVDRTHDLLHDAGLLDAPDATP
jgi:bifunctional enzyme CysN/CysC